MTCRTYFPHTLSVTSVSRMVTVGRDTLTSNLGRTGIEIVLEQNQPPHQRLEHTHVGPILTIFFEVEASGGLLSPLVPDGDDVSAQSGLCCGGVREVQHATDRWNIQPLIDAVRVGILSTNQKVSGVKSGGALPEKGLMHV